MSLHDALLAKAFGGGTGGGGGGSASIDVTAEVGQTIIVKEVDASGKPTAWESAEYQPRTHYKTTEYLIPETTIEGSSFETLAPALLVEGETYIVNWNGVDYTCTAFGVSMDGVNAVFIGNAIILGGDNTGEPFVIGTMLVEGNKVAMGMSVDDTVESFTFSIKGYVYTPIPVQYVTNALPYYIEVTGEGTDDDPYVCNDTMANVEAVYGTGRSILARLNTGLYELIFSLVIRIIEDGENYSLYFLSNLAALNNNVMLALRPNSEGGYDVTYRS